VPVLVTERAMEATGSACKEDG